MWQLKSTFSLLAPLPLSHCSHLSPKTHTHPHTQPRNHPNTSAHAHTPATVYYSFSLNTPTPYLKLALSLLASFYTHAHTRTHPHTPAHTRTHRQTSANSLHITQSDSLSHWACRQLIFYDQVAANRTERPQKWKVKEFDDSNPFLYHFFNWKRSLNVFSFPCLKSTKRCWV